MKLEQLEQLIEIDRQKSISKAAKALYIGQSTLSGSLASLEEELGVRLFERTASGVIITNEGKEAVQLAKQMMDSAQQMRSLGKQEKELYGTVTVAIGQAYSFLLKDILIRFKEQHPKAKLKFHIFTPDQVVEELVEGHDNIVVALLPQIYKNQTAFNRVRRDVRSEVFGKSPFQVYVGKNNRFAERTAVTLDEIRGEQFVTNALNYWNLLRPVFQPDKEVLEVADRDVLKQMVSECNYVALMPGLFMHQDVYIEQGLIKMLDISGNVLKPTKMMLLYPAKRKLTLLEQSTIEIIREQLCAMGK